MNHAVRAIRIWNYLLLLVSKRNKTKASIIKDNEIVTIIHKALYRRFPQLKHFKSEFYEAIFQVDHNDYVLIDMNCLVTDDHLNFFLFFTFQVFTLRENKV